MRSTCGRGILFAVVALAAGACRSGSPASRAPGPDAGPPPAPPAAPADAGDARAGWVRTGDMETARRGHTATLLGDGRVVVVGEANSPVPRAEIYDPKSGTWTRAAAPSKARETHAAAPLPGGRAVVTGGFESTERDVRYPVDVKSAEVYDPARDEWTVVATPFARQLHTATPLPDGRVLVVGGRGPEGTIAEAEIFDPAADAWQPAGRLATGRANHSATLLRDGRVLVAGGIAFGTGAEALASTEIFDPAAGTWTPGPAMRTARYLHAAILLPDGRVLAAGGTQWEQGPLGEAEVLDAAAGAWTAVSPLHAPRADAVATPLPDGRVLVTGIGPAAEGARLFGEVFDPAAGTWSLAPPLSSPRTGHTATVLPDGRILIAGGWSEVGVLKDCYLFVPGAALRGSGTTPVR